MVRFLAAECIQANAIWAQVAPVGTSDPAAAAGIDQTRALEHKPHEQRRQRQDQALRAWRVPQLGRFNIPAMTFPIATHFFDPLGSTPPAAPRRYSETGSGAGSNC